MFHFSMDFHIFLNSECVDIVVVVCYYNTKYIKGGRVMLTNEQKQRIDKIFDLWVQHQGAGGQLLVVHKGETVYEQCYCY